MRSRALQPRSGARRAFTLLELMVVLVVLGVLSAMILPEMRGSYSDAVLRGGSRDLADLCALASSRAISFQRDHRVRLDPATGRFQLEGYKSSQHMLRSIAGAALMGAGGAMAYGCSVGQGLTGLSTLSLLSFIAVAGILIGSTLGLRGALRVRPLAVA